LRPFAKSTNCFSAPPRSSVGMIKPIRNLPMKTTSISYRILMQCTHHNRSGTFLQGDKRVEQDRYSFPILTFIDVLGGNPPRPHSRFRKDIALLVPRLCAAGNDLSSRDSFSKRIPTTRGLCCSSFREIIGGIA
jgi:hypothetical protein